MYLEYLEFVAWVMNNEGRYAINGSVKKAGTFGCKKKFTSSNQINLGVADKPLQGAIAVFEGCRTKHGMIPDKIIDLLIKDQDF